jgi:PhoH-like ATPase
MGFSDNIVVLPEAVLEELDNKKRDPDPEIRANVRWVARFMDNLRAKGKLNEGVALENGGLLRVELNCLNVSLPKSWAQSKMDNRILAVAKGKQAENKFPVVIVTKDIFLRIKADILGIPAQDYFNEQVVDLPDQYTGWEEIEVADNMISNLYAKKKIAWKHPMPNQFFILKGKGNSALAKCVDKSLVLLNNDQPSFYSFKLDAAQRFVREALEDDSIPLVTISGATGSGKTMLALGVGINKIETGYRRMLICRPTVGMGEDLGFLPGTEQEKITPYMRPIYDNLEQLLDSSPDRYDDEKRLDSKVNYLFMSRKIVTEAIAYLQGRSLVKQFVLIDEAQNLTPKQAKGIITRAGEGTKIILVGDVEQINHPYLDSRTNGLSWVIETMKGSSLYAHVCLTNTKRSKLAMEAAERMR